MSRVAPCGAAILQHDLYTASALAVDVPPLRWLRNGSRGDSLHGLVHTSPLRLRVRPGGATVATTPVYVHPAAAERQRGQLQKKTAVEVALNDCQGVTLSNGGCNPRYELLARFEPPKHHAGLLQQLVRIFMIPPLRRSVNPKMLCPPRYVTPTLSICKPPKTAENPVGLHENGGAAPPEGALAPVGCTKAAAGGGGSRAAQPPGLTLDPHRRRWYPPPEAAVCPAAAAAEHPTAGQAKRSPRPAEGRRQPRPPGQAARAAEGGTRRASDQQRGAARGGGARQAPGTARPRPDPTGGPGRAQAKADPGPAGDGAAHAAHR